MGPHGTALTNLPILEIKDQSQQIMAVISHPRGWGSHQILCQMGSPSGSDRNGLLTASLTQDLNDAAHLGPKCGDEYIIGST